MSSPITSLLQSGTPDATEVDAFIERNRFPIVEEHNITFVYRGAADRVLLRCWISGLNTAQPFERIDGTDLWVVSIELPPGSRIEYKFERFEGEHGELITDPLNPLLAHDPFGANSVCQGAGYERPDWTLPDPEVRAGSLARVQVPSVSFGGAREVGVYLPARFRRNSADDRRADAVARPPRGVRRGRASCRFRCRGSSFVPDP